MNVISNLLSFSNSNENDIYRFVAHGIVGNLQLLQTGSIYDVADACASSTATVSRLSQKLGYKNFSDLKHNITDAVHFYSYANRTLENEQSVPVDSIISEFCDSIISLAAKVKAAVVLEDIEKLIGMIDAAASVRFYSFNEVFTEISLQMNLMMANKFSIVLDRFQDQIDDIKTLGSRDLIIFIYPDNSSALDIIPLTSEAKELGVTTALITNSRSSVHRARTNISFAFDGNGTSADLWGMQMILSAINIMYRRSCVDKHMQYKAPHSQP